MSNDLSHHARVKELFHRALELPPAERSLFLEQACDPQAVEEVEQLLASHEKLGDATIKTPGEVARALDEHVSQLGVGSGFGRWCIDGLVGSGGMGAVYRAHRIDGAVEQAAALKLIRPDALSVEAMQRFRLERQVLARLDHPNISRLIDAGEEDGQPFYVMEYVDGQPITQFCRAKGLGLDDRISMFQQVCAAVHHAHANLIVHGDIKPGNVLVDETGTPKLVDFGIARAVGGQLPGARKTIPRLRAFSPHHAAPEQLLGEPLSTACDIYGLGVLLYELICGIRPFQFDQHDVAQMQRAVLEERPAAPSSRVNSVPQAPASGNSDSARARARLRARLRGDLDAICLHALRKKPARRYASAEQFSTDLDRWKEHRPVLARAGSWRYRTGKLLRRHRAAVMLIGTVTLLLIGFSSVLMLQSIRLANERDAARQQRLRAEQVSEFLVDTFKAADPTESLGRTITAREVMMQSRDELLSGLPQDSKLRAHLMQTMANVLMNLGLVDEAQPLADGVHELLVGDAQESSLLHRSFLLRAKLAQARGHYAQAFDMVEQAAAITTGERSEIAAMLEVRAAILAAQDQREEARAAYERVLAMRQTDQGARHPQTLRTGKRLASTIASMGDNEAALALLIECLANQREVYPASHPELAATLQTMAKLERRLRRYDEARVHALEALEIYSAVYGNDHLILASVENTLANIDKREGLYASAVARYERSLEINRRYLGDENPRVAMAMYNLGVLYHQRLSQPAKAATLLAPALQVGLQRWGDAHTNVNIFRLGYGAVLSDLGHHDEARRLVEQALRAFEVIAAPRGLNVAYARAELGSILAAQGDFAAARVLLNQALPVLREHLPGDDFDVIRAEQALAVATPDAITPDS